MTPSARRSQHESGVVDHTTAGLRPAATCIVPRHEYRIFFERSAVGGHLMSTNPSTDLMW
jgi:hypothetical protein